MPTRVFTYFLKAGIFRMLKFLIFRATKLISMYKPLALLDKILVYLSLEPYKTHTMQELHKRFYKRNLDDGYEGVQLYEALEYLVSVGLLAKNDRLGGYVIKIEGLIKYASGGFHEQFRNAKISRRLDWIQKTIAPLIAASALVLSLVNSCSNK